MAQGGVGGRPRKLTEELLEKLEKLLERQSSFLLTDEEVIDHIGIDNQTKQNWLNPNYKGADEELKLRFFELIKRSRRHNKMNLGDRVIAGRNGWQGSAWSLERKCTDLNLKNISEVKQTNHNYNSELPLEPQQIKNILENLNARLENTTSDSPNI